MSGLVTPSISSLRATTPGFEQHDVAPLPAGGPSDALLARAPQQVQTVPTAPGVTLAPPQSRVGVTLQGSAGAERAVAPVPADAVAAATPARIAEIKARVLELTRANTLRTDNLAEVRAQLEPLVAELAAYYAANRPDDETTRLRGNWKSVWYDNADITDRGPARLQRDRIYQVVEDGFYYNVANYSVFGGTVSTFLRGDYTIVNRPTPETAGQQGLNVVALTFGESRLRLGGLPPDDQVRDLALAVARRDVRSVPTPGPEGVTGRLWNLYLDDTLRISAGYNTSSPELVDYYVLTRVEGRR